MNSDGIIEVVRRPKKGVSRCREERQLRAKVKRLAVAICKGFILTEAIKESGLNCSINKAHTLLSVYLSDTQLSEVLRLIRWE